MSIIGIENTNRAIQYEHITQQSSSETASFAESMQKIKVAAAEGSAINKETREREMDQLRADLAARTDSPESLREQLSAMGEEWKAGSSLQKLMLWSDALQSAREGRPEEQESIWDILFEQRTENHRIAMDLSLFHKGTI